MNNYKLITRKKSIFIDDINQCENILKKKIKKSKILILGAAGTIGSATLKEIYKREPAILHAVDISENNLVELVRDIRSSLQREKGEFKTFVIDIGSKYFKKFYLANGPYDYVINLSAMKHVRSERDCYSLWRMIDINIINNIKILNFLNLKKTKKYFCVSTDKATNPVNLMGATKLVMEFFLLKYSKKIKISSARFANVAFSDGSLLYGFNKRFFKKQPISCPNNIKRYFITEQEAAHLCLLSIFIGKNREIFFPKIKGKVKLYLLKDIAKSYLKNFGYKPKIFNSEDEAKKNIKKIVTKKEWPCFFFKSVTTGEKEYEEFYSKHDKPVKNNFKNISIIQNNLLYSKKNLNSFLANIKFLKKNFFSNKKKIIHLFKNLIPGFGHEEKNKNLDQIM